MTKKFPFKSVFSLLFFFWFSSFFGDAYGQNLSWLNHYQGNSNIEVRSLDFDSLGFVFVGGVFRDTFFYDPADTSKWTVSIRNNSFRMSADNFIQKLDINGKVIWTRWFGSREDDNIQGIKISKSGHLYAFGIFQNTVDFDLDTTVYELSSAGVGDAFMAKYDLDGRIFWAKSFKGQSTVATYGLDVDEDDNVYVTGMHMGLANFNTDSSGMDSFTSLGFSDMFVAKLNDTGKLEWVNSYGSYPGQFMRNQGRSISYDGYGGIWVAGQFRDSLYINMQGKAYIASQRRNSDDGLIFKLNKSGTLLYAEAITTSTGSGTTSEVINDTQGNAFICGYGRGDIAIDTHLIGTRYGNEDPYLFKLDSNFNFQWGLNISNTRNSRAFSIALNSEGINMVGWFRDDSAQVDPLGSGKFIHPVSTNNIAFILTYDPADGELRNALVYASSGETRPNSIKTKRDKIIIGGNFSSSGDFNPGQGIDSLFSRRNSQDGYLQFFNNCPSSFFTLDTAVCDSFYWSVDSTWYFSSTTKRIVTQNSVGCDSVITLRLSVGKNTFDIDSIFICDSFTWINGITYFESNDTAIFVTQNHMGCDSVITLNLTINESSTFIDNVTSCDSFTWINGVTYFESNDIAKFVTQNHMGCDSVITLNLALNESSKFVDNVTACDSFTWFDGNTYFADNNLTRHIIQNYSGCDSVITLNLTINESSTFIDNVTSCDSFTWINGVTYFESNDIAKFVTQNHMGCDSVITLNLALNESSKFVDNVTACDSFTWFDGNTYFADNNLTRHIIQNYSGCDSVITLNLTINESSTFIDNVTSCDSFTWINGVTYFESNDIAKFVTQNHMGCDSVITLNLEITNIDTSVTVSGNTLRANSTLTAYQWLDCDNNNSPIHGETNQIFITTESGNYSVELTKENCVKVSNCHSVSTNSTTVLYQEKIEIYPNPTNDIFSLSIPVELIGSKFKLINSVGQVIHDGTFNKKINELSLRNYPFGVYFIEIDSHFNTIRKKVIKGF
jgi:PDZ domain-containing secreted protein